MHPGVLLQHMQNVVCRYDPGTSVSDDITTEADRVIFLQAIAQSMLTKARIKLNVKRLYAADAVAVKDLLKMAALLYKAMHTKTDAEEVPNVLLCMTHQALLHAMSLLNTGRSADCTRCKQAF